MRQPPAVDGAKGGPVPSIRGSVLESPEKAVVSRSVRPKAWKQAGRSSVGFWGCARLCVLVVISEGAENGRRA